MEPYYWQAVIENRAQYKGSPRLFNNHKETMDSLIILIFLIFIAIL